MAIISPKWWLALTFQNGYRMSKLAVSYTTILFWIDIYRSTRGVCCAMPTFACTKVPTSWCTIRLRLTTSRVLIKDFIILQRVKQVIFDLLSFTQQKLWISFQFSKSKQIVYQRKYLGNLLTNPNSLTTTKKYLVKLANLLTLSQKKNCWLLKYYISAWETRRH